MADTLSGVLTALVTPFDDDKQIDGVALDRLVERSISGGVDGVVSGGSTGDFASLTVHERRTHLERVIERTDHRATVVAQTGAMTTREAIALSRSAEQAGADVLMLVTPYYEPLSEQEAEHYLRSVADAVSLPIMLYNIPSCTGFNLRPQLVERLVDRHENVRYIKDSSADWDQNLQLIRGLGDRIGTFVGWDPFIYSAITEGASGVMAGTANVVPREICEVVRLLNEGAQQQAAAAWQRLYPVVAAMAGAPFNAAIRAGLEVQGVPVGPGRQPAAPLEQSQHDAITHAINVFNGK